MKKTPGEIALEEYPIMLEKFIPAHDDMPEIEQDCNRFLREAYQKGYERAKDDILKDIHAWASNMYDIAESLKYKQGMESFQSVKKYVTELWK